MRASARAAPALPASSPKHRLTADPADFITVDHCASLVFWLLDGEKPPIRSRIGDPASVQIRAIRDSSFPARRHAPDPRLRLPPDSK